MALLGVARLTVLAVPAAGAARRLAKGPLRPRRSLCRTGENGDILNTVRPGNCLQGSGGLGERETHVRAKPGTVGLAD